jgi:hypothetical protein
MLLMNVMQKYLKQKHIGITLVMFSVMRENERPNYKRLNIEIRLKTRS